MARMSRTNCLVAMLIVAFVVSGCQSSNNKWTAWKERSKPKQKFQGVDESEEVTYWPNRPSKGNSKMTEIPGQLKAKMARKSEQRKRDTELTELIHDGDQFRKNNQFEDARLAYSKALMISPENPDVNHRLAIIADKQRQYAVADEYYQAALKVRPRDANLLSDNGYSYALRGNTQQAEVTLKQALAINKSHKGAMANLGAIYAQQNRYNEAYEMFRNGATEAEAQQYIAKLFPQGPSGPGAPPALGLSNPGPVIAARSDTPRDLSKMSFEQIQAEMARLKQEAEMRRIQADQQMLAQSRRLAAEERNIPQQMAPANPANRFGGTNPSMALGPQNGDHSGYANNPSGFQRQSDLTMMQGQNGQSQLAMANGQPNSGSQSSMMADSTPATTQTAPQSARIFRGSGSQPQQMRPNDPQIQQAWDQQPSSTQPNNVQQANGSYNSSQMAMQLGMSAGPGSMFPIVPATNNNGAGQLGTPPSGDNRFGSEFQRSPTYQNPSNWNEDSNEQRFGAGAKNTANDENAAPIAPTSPVNNWGSPSTGTLNWQNHSANASDWSRETQTVTGAAGTGLNSQVNSSGRGQNPNIRSSAFDNIQPSIISNPPRNDGEASRPYNGVWPNANSFPQQQNMKIPLNNRSPETIEMMGINPANSAGNANSNNQNGNSGTSLDAGNSPFPIYPYAPNR